MADESDLKLDALMERLGHVFRKPALLQDALTHPSLSKGGKGSYSPYERLEFLGDRVLGLVIADWLYKLYPHAKEGELAVRHAALVNGDACREVATTLHLEEALRLAHGDDALADRKYLAAMSDAMEAVIGALYLDAGLGVASAFIHSYWDSSIHRKRAPAEPKTSLQEWAQGRGLPLPAYQIVSRSGPAHAPEFEIEVTVKGLEPVCAKGNSKREAEKAAALLLLQEIEKA